MKDIKELIFAAVEENAVKFQEMANELLHARAYEAIESLRPEAAASMFGEEKESKKKGNESGDDMDDEDDSGEMDEEVEEKDPYDRMMNTAYNAALKAGHKPHSMGFTKDRKKVKMISDTGHGHYDIASKKYVHSKVNEEVELDEADEKQVALRIAHARNNEKLYRADMPPMYGASSNPEFEKKMRAKAEKEMKGSHAQIKKTPVAKFLKTRKGDGKVRTEETNIQEVAPPKNQADWQALINHQIKVTGHPVATDAQFRATTVGKDTTKIASQEPGEDKMNYAKAQGGEVKQ